ncbi:MAG: hypothetical protein IV100_12135 [Myxococcales bacterium]|nr:hypothetical protein [Myxococcales bacterium]
MSVSKGRCRRRLASGGDRSRRGAYQALVEQNETANPLPVDVVVNRQRAITCIAREQDPAGIIDAVLAE